MKEHRKHPKADRLETGKYHKNEFGIYGTDCGSITNFVKTVFSELSDLHCLYVDADHHSENSFSKNQIKEKQFHTFYESEVFDQDKIFECNDADVVFVNGNHYPASNQIIIINEKKKDSLKRRVEQLDSIFAVIVQESEDEIYDFVQEKMLKSTLVLTSKNTAQLTEKIRQKSTVPELKALILAGGKSMRMGEDKSQIKYHTFSQSDHLKQLCESCGLDTYVSKGHDYSGDETSVIKDRMIEMGPFGAIITAFMKHRNVAWLVIACDMPFVTKESIQHLIANRNSSLLATTYCVDEKAFPEPTFSIYEPKIYKRMMEFYSLGYTCPRKALINSKVEKVVPQEQNVLKNVNTKEEKESVLNELSSHGK